MAEVEKKARKISRKSRTQQPSPTRQADSADPPQEAQQALRGSIDSLRGKLDSLQAVHVRQARLYDNQGHAASSGSTRAPHEDRVPDQVAASLSSAPEHKHKRKRRAASTSPSPQSRKHKHKRETHAASTIKQFAEKGVQTQAAYTTPTTRGVSRAVQTFTPMPPSPIRMISRGTSMNVDVD